MVPQTLKSKQSAFILLVLMQALPKSKYYSCTHTGGVTHDICTCSSVNVSTSAVDLCGLVSLIWPVLTVWWKFVSLSWPALNLSMKWKMWVFWARDWVEGEERWHPEVFISCLCLHWCAIETVKAVNWSFQNRNRCCLWLKAYIIGLNEKAASSRRGNWAWTSTELSFFEDSSALSKERGWGLACPLQTLNVRLTGIHFV